MTTRVGSRHFTALESQTGARGLRGKDKTAFVWSKRVYGNTNAVKGMSERDKRDYGEYIKSFLFRLASRNSIVEWFFSLPNPTMR